MKKLKVVLRLISAIGLLIGVMYFLKAPDLIATHITLDDKVDSIGKSYQIFLLPILQIFINEFLLFIAKKQRSKINSIQLNFILANEWKYISLSIVLLFVFTILMYQQISLR